MILCSLVIEQLIRSYEICWSYVYASFSQEKCVWVLIGEQHLDPFSWFHPVSVKIKACFSEAERILVRGFLSESRGAEPALILHVCSLTIWMSLRGGWGGERWWRWWMLPWVWQRPGLLAGRLVRAAEMSQKAEVLVVLSPVRFHLVTFPPGNFISNQKKKHVQHWKSVWHFPLHEMLWMLCHDVTVQVSQSATVTNIQQIYGQMSAERETGIMHHWSVAFWISALIIQGKLPDSYETGKPSSVSQSLKSWSRDRRSIADRKSRLFPPTDKIPTWCKHIQQTLHQL